jgi:hypothetical protein
MNPLEEAQVQFVTSSRQAFMEPGPMYSGEGPGTCMYIAACCVEQHQHSFACAFALDHTGFLVVYMTWYVVQLNSTKHVQVHAVEHVGLLVASWTVQGA